MQAPYSQLTDSLLGCGNESEHELRYHKLRIFLHLLVWIGFWLLSALPANAQADWRSTIGIFRIGIVTSEDPANELRRLEPFRLALTRALRLEVEFFAGSDVPTLIDALRNERIEYAVLPASAYALAWVTCECVEPLVVPRASDSTDGYRLILFSTPGNDFELSQAVSKRIGIVSDKSVIGRRFAQYFMQKDGHLEPSSQPDFVQQSSSFEAAEALERGAIDALIGWSSLTGEPGYGYSRGTLTQISRSAEKDVSGYQILWRSPQISHRTHVVRAQISNEAKDILRKALTGLYRGDPVAYDAIEPLYGGGFAEARHDRFSPIIEYMNWLFPKPSQPEASEDASETEKKAD